MTDQTASETKATQVEARPKNLRWWKEVIVIVVFYVIYSFVRNRFGSNAGDADLARQTAFENARSLINFENSLKLFVEEDIQGWFVDDGALSARWFIRFWNFYYGITHFVITIFAFVWAYIRHPKIFPTIRNVGLLTTGLGLVGFATFPVLPPRLLDSSYGFLDTIKEFGGFLSFDSPALDSISNQYAAMPSIHFAWALWCAYVFVPRVKYIVWKILAVLYPIGTLFAVIVTGNHYWVDALGGLAIFLMAYALLKWSFPALAKTPFGKRVKERKDTTKDWVKKRVTKNKKAKG